MVVAVVVAVAVAVLVVVVPATLAGADDAGGAFSAILPSQNSFSRREEERGRKITNRMDAERRTDMRQDSNYAESSGDRIGTANQSARRELIRAQCLSCLHGLLRVIRHVATSSQQGMISYIYSLWSCSTDRNIEIRLTSSVCF